MNETYIDNYINTEEPVLFEAIASMSDKDVVDFNKFAYKRRNVSVRAVNIILSIVMGFQALVAFFIGSLFLAIMFTLVTVFLIFSPAISFKRSAAASIHNGYHSGNVTNYRFYQDCIVLKNNFSFSAIPYGIIVDAHETEEYFYIFITKLQAHIIPKASFVYNTPEEMRKLLTMKLGSRFIVHCK